MLLQEYHFFGESIGDKVPRPQHTLEAEKFLDWLHALVMREGDERSTLHFAGEYTRVGVLLIAKEDTYRKYGLGPYLRRANTYASDDFDTIYLISRGARRSRVTKQIAAELASLGCFEQLTKRPDIYTGAEADEGIITCIPMRIDLVGLVQAAWSHLLDAYGTKEEITVVVKNVERENVAVDAFGLRVDISPAELSAFEIPDARRYFAIGQELLVRVTTLEEGSYVRLSNVGTATDPKKVIDDFANKVSEEIEAAVVSYSIFDAYETGLFVQPKGFDLSGYIPRSKATYSRFVQLSSKYRIDSTVMVRPLRFDVEHGTYSCEIAELRDPWLGISKYKVGDIYHVTIRQLRERYLTCELEEGLEGTVYVEEVSWDALDENIVQIKSYHVNDIIAVKILAIEEDRHFIRLSIKRIEQSAVEVFFAQNANSILPASVLEIKSNGAIVEFVDSGVGGFLPIAEVSRTYCDGLEGLLEVNQIVSVRLTAYSSYFNSITVSVKATKRNDYEAFTRTHEVGAEVTARVDLIKKNQIDLDILFGESLLVSGYVYKSEISNMVFVSEDNISQFFELNKMYPFVIKSFHERSGVVELSRKLLFEKEHQHLVYGHPYRTKIVSRPKGGPIAYSDVFEGKL